mmetsp:Transcript_31946/g.61476  ORF Transcript_31946/g.61476 Transcript_31946/m.61476 type:complete len:371 (-) Transcript_31946:1652-2764(-)
MSSLLPQLVHAGARISKAIHAGSFKCANAVHAKKASTSLQLPFRTLFTSSKTHRAQAHPQPRAARAFVPQIPPSSHSSVRFAGGNIWREIHSQSNAKSEANLITARRLAAPIGLVAGLFGSLVGVGGGVLIVPIITGFCNVSQRIVTGSSLAAVISTGCAAAVTYSDHQLVDHRAAALMASLAVLFAPAGARLTARLDCVALKRVLGYFLVTAALMLPLKSFLFTQQSARHVGSPPCAPDPAPGGVAGAAQSVMFAAVGGVAGLASGLLGIGGGTIVTPMLALCTSMPQSSIVATSLFAMIPPSVVGLLQHHRLGNVDWRMAGALAVGTAVGSSLGSNMALRAPDGVLESLFCVGMLFLGWRTLASVGPR